MHHVVNLCIKRRFIFQVYWRVQSLFCRAFLDNRGCKICTVQCCHANSQQISCHPAEKHFWANLSLIATKCTSNIFNPFNKSSNDQLIFQNSPMYPKRPSAVKIQNIGNKSSIPTAYGMKKLYPGEKQDINAVAPERAEISMRGIIIIQQWARAARGTQ